MRYARPLLIGRLLVASLPEAVRDGCRLYRPLPRFINACRGLTAIDQELCPSDTACAGRSSFGSVASKIWNSSVWRVPGDAGSRPGMDTGISTSVAALFVRVSAKSPASSTEATGLLRLARVTLHLRYDFALSRPDSDLIFDGPRWQLLRSYSPTHVELRIVVNAEFWNPFSSGGKPRPFLMSDPFHEAAPLIRSLHLLQLVRRN